MVVKTELCAFSEYRIYPGHGIRFVRRDGQPVTLATSKAKSMLIQRKKPQLLHWTQTWRRLNKKGKDEGIAKKKSRKVVKVQRAVVGATLDDLKTRRQPTKPKVASAATEAALKEVKSRAKKGSKADHARPANSAVVPKQQRSGRNATGGVTR